MSSRYGSGAGDDNRETYSITSIRWPHKPESIPANQVLYQNLDFSTFPYLVKEVYRRLELIARCHPRLGQLPPYCVFLHVCTGVLNAAILKKCKQKLFQKKIHEKYFSIELPAPITEYITYIAETNTIFGHSVYINVPEVAVPKVYSPSTPEIPAGSFGPADEFSHNVYECYVSPFVTRRYVEATRDGEEDWEPLPEHLKPVGGIPNENLLGYDRTEELNHLQKKLLDGEIFCDDVVGVDQMLQWSDYLARKVNDIKRNMFHFYEFKPVVDYLGLRNYWYDKRIEGMIGFVEGIGYHGYGYDGYLARLNCHLFSWQQFGERLGNIQICFGLKRKRNKNAPGLCYTVEKEAPSGWMEHINDNFEMKGIFGAERHEGNCQLQCENFGAFNICRQVLLSTYIQHYEKKRPDSSDED